MSTSQFHWIVDSLIFHLKKIALFILQSMYRAMRDSFVGAPIINAFWCEDLLQLWLVAAVVEFFQTLCQTIFITRSKVTVHRLYGGGQKKKKQNSSGFHLTRFESAGEIYIFIYVYNEKSPNAEQIINIRSKQ